MNTNKYLGFAFLVLTFALICSAGPAAALDPTRIGIGARSIALGRTAAAIDADINSMFVNPAAAAGLKGLAVESMHTNLSEDISYTSLGVAKPYGFGTLGIAYLGSGSAGFQSTYYESGRILPTGNSFDYSSSVISLVYGQKVREDISLGMNIKLFNKGFGSVSGGTGSGYDLDLGLLWKPQDNLTVGVAQQNTLPSSIANIKWGTGLEEGIPFNTKAGVAYKPRDNLLIAADLDYAASTPLTLHGGVEWHTLKWLALRIGLDQLASSSTASTTNFAAGVGLNFRDFMFDYAYYYDTLISETNSAHYFSIAYQLDETEPIPLPEPEPAKVVKPKPAPVLKNFIDVPPDHWANHPIELLGGLGVIGGYPDGTFRPGNTISRAELTTLLVKAKNFAPSKLKSPEFKDLPVNHWASGYVARAVANGWLKGYPDDTFKPNKTVSRAEAISIISHFDELIPSSTPSLFPDVASAHWASRSIAAAQKAGLLSYLSGKNFVPNRPLTRAEAAEIISRTSFIRGLL